MIRNKNQMLGKSLFAILALASSLAILSPSQAAIVFSDDFESPTASTNYNVANTSGQINTTKWQRTNTGAYGATRVGIVSEIRTGENFTDPVGAQAYTSRYSSNTGLTSQYQQIGALTAGTTITVSFDTMIDNWNSTAAYTVSLVLFNGAGTRNLVPSTVTNTDAILAQSTGTATSSWATKTFSYTVGDVVIDNDGAGAGTATTWDPGLLGYDIAIRIGTGGHQALFDNVSVDIVPEPRAALLGGLGLLALLLRRRS